MELTDGFKSNIVETAKALHGAQRRLFTITRFNAKLWHWSVLQLKVSYCLPIWLQGGKDHGSSFTKGCGLG